MAVKEYSLLQEKVSLINQERLYRNICKNIKKFRVEKYNEFKTLENRNLINPYSSENISALLDYSHNHYKRFESETDSTKRIPLEKLVKLSIILEKDIEDFFKD